MKSILLVGLGLSFAGAACGGPAASDGSRPPPLSFMEELRADRGARIEATVTQTNLVADQPGQASGTDPHLMNAWGLAFNPAGPAWVSSAGNGTSQVYAADGRTLAEVVIPPPTGGQPPSSPTGQVFNWAGSNAFMGDTFIFVTEDGTVAGWQTSHERTAVLRADQSASMALYKGVTIATPFTGAGRPQLYAANFRAATVDVWDDHYAPVTASGGFHDRELPADYAPFNVLGVGPFLLVTYAQQNDEKKDDVKGVGHGFVDLFTAEGFFIQRLISGGALNSPWGLVFAPDNDRASIDLGVGNFGDGHINVYDLSLRQGRLEAGLEGALGDNSGKPLVIEGLWALAFGPGTSGFASNQLYFTAGPNEEKNGLFGSLAFSGKRR
ncbi:MAG TPA: TIGR03118 family protein [Polyangia bacterium]|jgi:uncharacterized protein (TIGR03118 family)|nr:TIGR03118 family protein [Polyangia bacterium]